MAKPFLTEVIIKIDGRGNYLDTIKTSREETSGGESPPIDLPNLPGRLTEDDIVSAISEKTTDI